MAPPGLRLVDPAAGAAPLVKSVALIGSYPPRRCGIATFTADVRDALLAASPNLRCDVFAMNDVATPYTYGPEVVTQIAQQKAIDYQAAAAAINALRPDVIFVQHEFGIFGGPAGEHLMLLLNATDRPVVTMLHTVLDAPDTDQRRVIERLVARSAEVVVMAEHGRAMLHDIWNVADEKISVIPHGAPDRALAPSDGFKDRLGFGGRELLFSFGLLSPNKGIEIAIRALPAIVAARPTALYVVLGSTHPHLVAREGERYRTSLLDLARELGVADHLRLIDEYTDTPRLVDYLQAADVYITPYLNPAQITSGTLSYAAALGKPIVSTPYWHARELLCDGVGRLVPFGDSAAIAREVTALLQDPAGRRTLRERMYAKARETIWSSFAGRALATLGRAKAMSRRAPPSVIGRALRPSPSLDGIARLTDSCGILQHSLFDVPDRRHGYCVDDNARALLLMHRLPGPADAERERLTRIFAAFVQHAWNPDRGRFRNFMSYDREWLETAGSEDSTGRALWSVAETVASSKTPGLRRWADSLAHNALGHLGSITAPRAIAFILLGLAALIEACWGGEAVTRLAHAKLGVLRDALGARARADQPWFEASLAYDNARLPEAMIRAGKALGDDEAVAAGLRALDWLCRHQTSDQGLFLPVATADIGLPLTARTQFDQQPVEAAATVDACIAALAVSGDARWSVEAERAYAWFFGANTLGAMIANPPGDCFDGLTWRGPNENMGAESVLSLQLAACALVGATGADATKTAARPLS
jgi:glycosyltransferase involved in cell wall biosynthesis